MKVSCPSCGTNYNIDDKRIPPGGAKLKCAKCQSTFPIKRDGAAVGAGAAPKSGPVPLPGAGTVKSNPAVPLPGGSLGYDMNVATNPAIPLPGSAGPKSGPKPGAVPLPGSRPATATVSAAVPLPGGM